MLNRSSNRFSQTHLWMLAVWFSLLLLPLLKVVPAPSTVTGHPWKTEFAASIVAVAVLLWIAAKKLNFTIDAKILFPLFLFIAWSGISAFWADSAFSTAHHTLVWSVYLLFFIGASEIAKNFSRLRLALGSLAVVVWILSVSCLFGYLEILQNPLAEGVFRITYSKYGEILIAVIPVFFAIALYAKTRLALFCGTTAAIGWAAVVVTLSRTSFLAGAIGLAALIIFLFFAFRPKRFYRRGAALAAIFLAVTFLPQLSLFGDAQNTSLYGRFTADNSYQQTSSHIRKLLWNVSFTMIEKNPVAGVGADNFAMSLNEYRAEYAARNPSDANTAVEDLMLERAHNEFLQIFAELGLIGVLLFAAFLFVCGKSFFANLKGERLAARSIVKIGAFAGILSFLASSVASSFSFRVMQNGFVFFFLLAILLSKKRSLKTDDERNVAPNRLRPLAVSLGFLAAVCLFLLSSTQAVSNYYAWRAEKTEEFAEAETFYRQAIDYNPHNASVYYSYGLRFYFKKEPEKAVPLLEKAVANGLDVSFAYSYLASAQAAAQDFPAAEATLARALKIYPRSTFLRVRYASLLEKKGEIEKANEQLEIARRIDDRQTKGWQELITTGARASALKARNDETIISPADLYPTGGLYAVLDEQAVENLFPQNDFR